MVFTNVSPKEPIVSVDQPTQLVSNHFRITFFNLDFWGWHCSGNAGGNDRDFERALALAINTLNTLGFALPCHQSLRHHAHGGALQQGSET